MSEKPDLLMVRRGSFLAPYAPEDGETLSAYPAGKAVKVRIAPGRSNQQLRLYWSLLRIVAENLDQDITKDDLHEWLKLKLGYTAPVKQRNGEIVEVPRSVAFDKMGHQEFTAYFAAAKALITQHLIPGLRSDVLEREARAMLGEAA